jgi:orotidine-5'-phosphate decarboxylase
MKSYKEWISKSSTERNTRIILALDLDGTNPNKLFEIGRRLLESTLDSLCAVKLQRQTILNLGMDRTRRILNLAHEEEIPCIVDDKMSDIGETNRAVAEAYFRLGFDALTASPFAGWLDGLQPLFQASHDKQKGVIILSYMSNPGAVDVAGRKVIVGSGKKPELQYLLFARRALQWGADGLIVGATRPKAIEAVKRTVDDMVPIYSPGVGTQGGRLARAAKAGTDFFILGRSIATSAHPERVAARCAKESRD